MRNFSKMLRKSFMRVNCLLAAMVLLCNFLSCSHEKDPSIWLPYIVASGQVQQFKYGYYKCCYAHYRDGVPVSGSEDIFKVPTGTVISYNGHEHIIVENEVFDANVWF